MTELSDLIRAERLALVEFLEALTPDEWATQSLCGAWTVRDVAAHLASAPAMSPLEATVGMARSGFRINKFNSDSARRWARRGTDDLLGQLRTNAETRAQPTGMPEVAGLVDAIVHGLDIRRPLGAPTSVSAEAFPPAADFSVGVRWPLTILVGGSARKRVAGVRLVADDVEWAHGQGPEAQGSAETLLLLLNGRAIGPGELTGHGAEQVYARLA